MASELLPDFIPVPVSAIAPIAINYTVGFSGADMADSVRTETGPTTVVVLDPVKSQFGGAFAWDFTYDFYNRLHISPNLYAFGTITADASTLVTIWNAYITAPVVLQSLQIPSGIGIVVAGPNVPKTILPLDETQYQITAETSGPPSFNEDLVFNFSTGYSFRFNVSGTRARLWPAAPNWSSGYQITYSFKTEILTSRSGKEQRSALRRTPRKTVEYTATLSPAELQTVKRLVWSWQQLPFVFPEEPRFVRSSTIMQKGTQTVGFESIPLWLKPDGIVVLSHDDQREMLTVDAINSASNTVTFTTATAFDWPRGIRIHYALSGYLEPSLSSTRRTSKAGEVSVVFNVDPASESFEDQPDADFTMWEGAPVLLKKPNWGADVSISSEHDVVSVDFDRGGVARFVPVKFSRELRQATYVGQTFLEAETLRKLFFRCRGRRDVFWAPTWEFDIQIAAVMPEQNPSFSVAGNDFFVAFAGSTVHQAVFVKWADGEVAYRRVMSIAAAQDASGAQFTSVTLSSGFSRPVDPDVDMVGWMFLWRFASDDMTMEWLTRSVAQTQVQFTTVEVADNLS